MLLSVGNGGSRYCPIHFGEQVRVIYFCEDLHSHIIDAGNLRMVCCCVYIISSCDRRGLQAT